jgi:hypothetical protein
VYAEEIYPRFRHFTPDVVAAFVVFAEVFFVHLLFILTFFFEDFSQPLPAIIEAQFLYGELPRTLNLDHNLLVVIFSLCRLIPLEVNSD